ncbi:hypothetical protein D3C78_1058790 [compost metagenome]
MAAVEAIHLQAEFLVLQDRRPLVGEQPLHQAFRTVLVLDHADAVIGGRQDAQRQHPVHGMDDGVVLVHQDMGVVETVLAGDPPVAVAGAVHAVHHRVVVQHAGRGRPQRVREALAVFREAERQVVGQRRHVLVGEIVLAHEDEDHAVDLVYRIGGEAGGTDQLVVRVGDDGHQIALFQVEGEAVVPAGNGALVEAHGLLREAHTTVQTLILERVDLAVDATQDDRHAADLDAFDLILGQLVGEQRRIPVVDEAPGGVLVGLVLALGLGVVGAGIADAGLHLAATDDRLVCGHEGSPDWLTVQAPFCVVRLRVILGSCVRADAPETEGLIPVVQKMRE